jgi:hypothetical protein
MRSLTTTILCLALLAPAAAFAAEGEAPGPAVQPIRRDGLTFGLAVGPGDFHLIPDIDGVDETVIEGAAVSLRIGRALHQRMLVMAIVEYVAGEGGAHAVIGAAGQSYITQRLFVRFGGGIDIWHESEAPDDGGGGVPLGREPRSHGGESYEFSLGGLGGLGLELLQLRDLAISAELEFAAALHANVTASDDNIYMINVSLMLGCQWF